MLYTSHYTVVQKPTPAAFFELLHNCEAISTRIITAFGWMRESDASGRSLLCSIALF